jgi:predicted DsbA family dithiol-disulfide isomerase
MDKYPLIIAGSRSITDYDILIDAMSAFLIDPDHIAEVISGKEPNGVDRLGEQMAEAFGIPVVPFPADWENSW